MEVKITERLVKPSKHCIAHTEKVETKQHKHLWVDWSEVIHFSLPNRDPSSFIYRPFGKATLLDQLCYSESNHMRQSVEKYEIANSQELKTIRLRNSRIFDIRFH